jgi:threonine aldolase
VRTNIVVAELERPALEVSGALAARGVLASVMDARTLRLVTHHDVDGAACALAAEILADVLGAR